VAILQSQFAIGSGNSVTAGDSSVATGSGDFVAVGGSSVVT
jgi:hypothetical protein